MGTKNPACEWLETNRMGSFAMGTIDRIPRRKYHSLLTIREPGVGESLNTLIDVGEYLEVDGKLFMLNSFEFGNRIEPKGFQHLREFSYEPFPKWVYDLDGVQLERTVRMDHESDTVQVHYALQCGGKTVRLRLRPFIACRPIHALTRENPFLDGSARAEKNGSVSFGFYETLPRLQMRVRGEKADFLTGGEWVRDVFHSTELARGYPAFEDFYAPGEFELHLEKNRTFVFEAGAGVLPEATEQQAKKVPRASSARSLIEKLEIAGEKYLISTRKGFHSVIAGYPWFGHWGRDTFISLPGFCIEAGDVKTANGILKSYGDLIVEGLTRHGIVCAFPEQGLIMTGIDTPLLYIRAVQLLADRATRTGFNEFMPVVCRILQALKQGADARVKVTPEGGLYVAPGPWAVTWMDVLADGNPVTPRAGFAVDINALFLNAVRFAMEWARQHDPVFHAEWTEIAERGGQAFLNRFWSEELGYLADSHDGAVADHSLRPNQLWALSLPYSPVSRDMGLRILNSVRSELLTPVGLRTLAPSDPKYIGNYRGNHVSRDSAYHQGTVWPWLLGIYADAVKRVEGSDRVRAELAPVLERLSEHISNEGCLGHIAEVFDGDAPHAEGGTPAQAWSVAEVLRVAYLLKD